MLFVYRTMTTELQGKCNLDGHNEKIALSHGQFYKAILGMFWCLQLFYISYSMLITATFLM